MHDSSDTRENGETQDCINIRKLEIERRQCRKKPLQGFKLLIVRLAPGMQSLVWVVWKMERVCAYILYEQLP
jgi:hypothetical protein